MKICTKCKEDKPSYDFYPDNRVKSGLQSQCIHCQWIYRQPLKAVKRITDQTYYRANKERIAEYSRTPERKKIQKEADLRYAKKYPERIRARQMVSNAKVAGKLEPSVFCESCGLPAETQAHHEDYSKPLEVDWLCHSCHRLLHQTSFELVEAK